MSLPLRCVCCGFLLFSIFSFSGYKTSFVFFCSISSTLSDLFTLFICVHFEFVPEVFGCLVSMFCNFSRYRCYYNKRLNIYHRNVCRYDSWISVCDLIAWLKLERAHIECFVICERWTIQQHLWVWQQSKSYEPILVQMEKWNHSRRFGRT